MLGELALRNTETELMDDPAIDASVLHEVLKDINRANKMLGGNNITIRAVGKLIKDNPKDSYTIVDMGCGDGTILREVALYCRKHNVPVKLIGIDLSDKTIKLGADASKEFPEIRFLQQDILKLNATDLECDILLCTLTMHHFSNTQIPIFLKQFAKLSCIGFVINDLQRNRLACWLFRGFRAIFIKTEIAKHDGLISIKSGFTKEELSAFSKALPSVVHTIKWQWAYRYVWIAETNRLKNL